MWELFSSPNRQSSRIIGTSLALLAVCSETRCTSHDAGLRPFHSDGCSAIPDGPRGDPQRWQSACVAHDRTYWLGGTADERLEADRRLRGAIRESGNPLVAEFVYLGVRFGGLPWLPTPWRWGWGFGWPYPRGYRALNDRETKAWRQLEMFGGS